MPSSIPTQFKIAGSEFGKLRTWKHWDNVNCFSGRYIYMFNETGLGIVIKVTDTKTRKKIDITEYDGW